MPKLLSTNAKLAKSVPGHLIAGLQLAPTDISGYNVCPAASEGCRAACLFSAGRGKQKTVVNGRVRKTIMFFQDRQRFWNELAEDLGWLSRKAKREGVKAAVRLNTISDLPWENMKVNGGLSIIELFPEIQFYDYTKVPERALAFAEGKLPDNYHLTFSRSESNEVEAMIVAAAGVNVAIVFDNLPSVHYHREVIDGDSHDARFLDPKNVVVGLKAKGDARGEDSGFMVKVNLC